MTKNFFDDQEEPLIPTPINKQSPNMGLSKLYGNKPKRLAILIGIPLIIIIAGIYFFFKVIKAPKTYDSAEITASKTLENINLANANTYIDLEQIIVNFAASSAKQNYLKLALTLQFSSEVETKAAHTKLPAIIDSFQTFLHELRATDLSGSGSVLHLKEELMKRVNKLTFPIVIKDILIKEMLVN